MKSHVNRSNPTSQINGGNPAPVNPSIYRPRYRMPTPNDGFQLETAKKNLETQPKPSLFDALFHVEARRQSVEEKPEPHQHVRWHPSMCHTLTVYIQPLSIQAWTNMVEKAMMDWQASALGLLQLTSVVRPDQAHIVVEWTPTSVLGRPNELGHTDRKISAPKWIQKARIQILLTPQIDKQLQSHQIIQRVYTTALHEFGHALGLEHSQNKKDVMYHRGWQNNHLSLNDQAQLQRLYQEKQTTHFI